MSTVPLLTAIHRLRVAGIIAYIGERKQLRLILHELGCSLPVIEGRVSIRQLDNIIMKKGKDNGPIN